MKIIIDATWFAQKKFDGSIAGGAARVLYELLIRLGDFEEHNFVLTNSNFDPFSYDHLVDFNNNFVKAKNVKVVARKFSILRISFINKFFRKINNTLGLSRFYFFVPNSILKNSDVYYSAVNSVPYYLRKKKNIKIFFTALDLLPLVKPEFSKLFYDYTKHIYDNLTKNTRILCISNSTKIDLIKYIIIINFILN